VIDTGVLIFASAATLVCIPIGFYVQKRNRRPSPRTNIVTADFRDGLARIARRRVATADIDPVSVSGTITFLISDQRALRLGAAAQLMDETVLREVDAKISAMSGMAAIVHADDLRAGLLRALAATQPFGITVTGVELHLDGPGGEQSGHPPTRFVA
jgi:hypothetical protein